MGFDCLTRSCITPHSCSCTLQGLGGNASAVRIQSWQGGILQWRHFATETNSILQIIGVTLFAQPGTNRGGINANPNTRLAIYSSIMETCGKGDDSGGVIDIDAGLAYVGPGVVFRNNTSNSGNGGAVSKLALRTRSMCLKGLVWYNESSPHGLPGPLSNPTDLCSWRCYFDDCR